MTTYVLECLPAGNTLTAQGNVLILHDVNGTERLIPIFALQGIRIKPPSGMTRGDIYLDVLKAPTGSVGLAGSSVNVGNEPVRCIYKKEQSEAAEQLYQYVLGVMTGPSQGSRPPASLADELMKLKSLLDHGALSQEEFEAAKKKLLEF